MPITAADIDYEIQRREIKAKIDAEIDRRSVPFWPQFRGAAARLLSYIDDPDRPFEVMVSGPAETGKAQPLDAIVYTPSGPRRMGDLHVGDMVLTPDGQRAPIDGIFPQGEQDVYRITFGDGDFVECTDDHLWMVGYETKGPRPDRKRIERYAVLTLRQIRQRFLRAGRGRRKFWIPLTQPATFDPRPIRIDPYVLGVLLGDGHLRRGAIHFSSADRQLVEEMQRRLGQQYHVTHTGHGYDYRITANGFRPRRPATGRPGYKRLKSGSWEVTGRVPGAKWQYLGKFETEEAAQFAIETHAPHAYSDDEQRGVGIWSDIAYYGLEGTHSDNKFIPDDYLYNSIEIRRDVLRGLLDTDGTVDQRTGSISFSSISRQLSEHVKLLVESLGGTAAIHPRPLPNGHTDYRVRISHDNPASLFLLDRKRERTRPRTQYPVKRMIAAIDHVDRRLCQCILIAHPDHLYLTDHFAVTHNTFAALWFVDFVARLFPGAQITICRKLRSTMDGTVLNTWRRVIAIRGGVEIYGGEKPEWYDYYNGSRVWIAGLDNPGKALSSERDLVYVNQAEDLDLDDWQTLTTRTTGRGGVAPWSMLIGDCNPGPPGHWIVHRASLTILESRHEDNPSLYDAGGQLTDQGRRTMAILDALEGVLKERLRFGRWVAAEGAVYAFDRRIHLIERMPEGWELWRKGRVIDFGYENPFVCLWVAIDGDGRVYVYRQLYMSHRTVDVHAETIKRAERWYKTAEDYDREAAAARARNELAAFEERYRIDDQTGWMVDRASGRPVPNPAREKIQISIADHDAEGRATLHKEGIVTLAAKKDVADGIQAVQKALRKAGDGRPRLYVRQGCLIERDEELAGKYHPTCIEQEFELYSWPKGIDGKPRKEEPVKMFDHAMDALRYIVFWFSRLGSIMR